MPLVVDPVMVACSGAQLLEHDAVEALVGGCSRWRPWSRRTCPRRVALAGVRGTTARARGAAVELGAPAVIVTGGHGEAASTTSSTARRTSRSPSSAIDVAATHGAGCTHSATLAALLARGVPLDEAARGAAAAAVEAVRNGSSELGAGDGPVDVLNLKGETVNAGESLRRLRETKPLVHQITNYVVMNETANATLALGALPVMAHAPRGGRGDGAPRRGARAEHRDALARLGRGDAAGRPRRERARRPGRPRSGRRGRDDLPDGDGEADPRPGRASPSLRGNAGEVATLVGVEAEVRGVESIGAGGRARRARASRPRSALGLVASVTGPIDHVSDGERRSRSRTAIRCWRRSPARAACRRR